MWQIDRATALRTYFRLSCSDARLRGFGRGLGDGFVVFTVIGVEAHAVHC